VAHFMEVCMEKLLLEDLDLIREGLEENIANNRESISENEMLELIEKSNEVLRKLHEITKWGEISPCSCGGTTIADLNVKSFEIEGIGCVGCKARLNNDASNNLIDDWNNGIRGEY